MKPLEGNFVQNALKHGVAGINVDGCRIGMGSEDRKAYEEKRHSFDGMTGKVCGDTFVKNVSPLLSSDLFIEGSKQGRWPSNVILGHLEGCNKVGMKKVNGINGGTGNHDGSVYGKRTNQGEPVRDYTDADGKETVEAWECQEGCPVRVMDEQSGNKCGACAPVKGTESSETGQNGIYGKYKRVASAFPNDGVGGASRFFKQVKS